MANGWDLVMHIGYGVGRLMANPLLYAFVLFIYLHYRKQMALERKLYAVRLQSPFLQTLRSIGMGLVGGLIISVACAALGIIIQPTDIWLVWMLSILFAFVRLRFLCFAYAAGALVFLQIAARLWPAGADREGIGVVWGWLVEAKPVQLLALIAVMHLVEGLLVRWNAGRDASPLFIEGKRGRIIGAYQLHSMWLTPLFLFVPVQPDGGVISPLFAGWPFFSPESAAGSFGLLFIPAVTGFSDLTKTLLPAEKASEISRQLVLYACLLLGLSYLAVWYPAVGYAAALFALLGHEGMYQFSQWRERSQPPFYIQSARGVKIMAVISGSPAEQMGLLPGEIIVKINGKEISQKEQLYPALQINPAYCKMEVLTYDNEIKFVSSALYDGFHHQLGIIVVPDSTTQYYVDIRRFSLVRLLGRRMGKVKLGA